MKTVVVVLMLALGTPAFAQTQQQAPIVALTPEQLAQAIAQIIARQQALSEQLALVDAHLTQHDTQPMWITRFMKSPFGIIATSVASTCVATQCWQRIGK